MLVPLAACTTKITTSDLKILPLELNSRHPIPSQGFKASTVRKPSLTLPAAKSGGFSKLLKAFRIQKLKARLARNSGTGSLLHPWRELNRFWRVVNSKRNFLGSRPLSSLLTAAKVQPCGSKSAENVPRKRMWMHGPARQSYKHWNTLKKQLWQLG